MYERFRGLQHQSEQTIGRVRSPHRAARAAALQLHEQLFVQPRREHCYNLADGNFKAIWNLGYKWAGNAKHMYDLAVAQNQPNFQAIGLTLKVDNMSILTDMFGSIAYREALKGGEGINTSHFDSQQEVYTAMLEELELANTLYNASSNPYM